MENRDRKLNLNLMAARVNAGLTRAEASRALGISENTLGNYERGNVEPGAIIFMRICELYDVAAENIRFDEKLLEKKGRCKSDEREADGQR